MLRDALKLAGKDLRLMYRDRGAVIMGYLVPLLLLVVFGIIYSGMGGSNENVKVDLLFVDKEQSDQSQKFLKALKSNDVLQITTTGSGESGTLLTADEARNMILSGKSTLALVYEQTKSIPGFQSLGMPVLTLYYDPSAGIERNITKGLINQAVFMSMGTEYPRQGMDYMVDRAGLKNTPGGDKMLELMDNWLSTVPTENSVGGSGGGASMMGHIIDLTEEEVVKPAVKEGNPFMASSVSGLIVLFLLFSVSYAAASLLKEQQEGTVRRLLLAPISADSIIMGKFIAVGFNSICQVFVMLLASMIIFRVNVFGNFLPVLVMSIATVAATTSFGMVIASMAKSYEQIQSSITMIVLTMSAVGGSMFPRILMPDWMKNLGFLTINGWAIDGYLDALYRFNGLGSILGYGEAHNILDVVHNSEAIVLLLFAVICGVIAGRVFRRRLGGAA
jgi:ABC-2 type transport system permease protein